MPRRPVTPEQAREFEDDRQRKLDALRARLYEDAKALRTPADWARCLNLTALMPGEDFANILLISSQRPDATLVRDYRQWTAEARKVRRGEAGIAIFHIPSQSRRPKDQAAGEQRLTWRDADRISHVWDLAQTTGPSMTARASPLPDQMPSAVWDALSWLARREGFAVERERGVPADGATFWTAHRIRLLPDLSAERAVRALAHQLGHVLLHNMPSHPPGTTTAVCRGVRKAEADSVAYVVCTHHGITIEHELSSPASWAGRDPRAQPAETILSAGQRITTASAGIIYHTDRILHGDESVAHIAACQQPAAPLRRGETRPHKATLQNADAETWPATVGPPPEWAERIHSVLAAALEFYVRQFAGNWAPAYLRGRGIGDAVSHAWCIGYAPGGWTTLTDHLHHLGCGDEDIQAAGLAKRSSRGTLIDIFRDRVMVPVHDENGAIAGFIGRAHPDAAPNVPKYLNSPETPGYKKSDLLFGLHQARSSLAQDAIPVIVEGPFDAIAVTIADPAQHAGLAPCGTALTSQQAALLSRAGDLARTGILIAFDDDTAGRKAAIRSYSILRPFTWKLQSVLLNGEDPAEVLQKEGPTALRTILRERRQMLSSMVIDARIESWEQRLRDPDGPYLAMRSAAGLVADLLPPGEARQIQGVIGDRELQMTDELLPPVSSHELIQIARALPTDIAYQVARLAGKLGFDYSEVLIEVTKVFDERNRYPKDPARAVRNNADRTQPTRQPTAAQLAHTSFARPPLAPQTSTDHWASRPASSSTPRTTYRANSARTTLHR